MFKEDLSIIELTEENIESMIYIIRGQKVILDYDLARIYGYTTKAFNQQVQRNIERFDEDFMFRLIKEELDQILRANNMATESEGSSRSQIVTMNKSDNKRGLNVKYLPYVFSEKGIYMLMTILKGPLAIQQSKTLIRLFEILKNYYIESNGVLAYNEVIKLTRKVDKHDRDIKRTNKKIDKVMEYFIDPSSYKHFLILNGQRIEADIAYQQIYSLAKRSIIVVDDYVDIKTLRHLKVCNPNIQVTICSDNAAKNKIEESDLKDFKNDTGINVTLIPTNNIVHDRYIVIDYKQNNEAIYDCGASSKDAGNKIMTIKEIEYKIGYHPLIDILLDNIKVL